MLDFQRWERIGISEAVLCEHKSAEQIAAILQRFQQRHTPCLLTRLQANKAAALAELGDTPLDYETVSQTAFAPGPLREASGAPTVAIVSGGTSDAAVCLEIARTLRFHGHPSELFQDVGVTGLWRLNERIDAIRRFSVVIAVAGMEGALFSVLGGLLAAPLIAVPTSVGYGVAQQGLLSLHSALGSCAPGISTVNIDNGYGAACAALRMLNTFAERT